MKTVFAAALAIAGAEALEYYSSYPSMPFTSQQPTQYASEYNPHTHFTSSHMAQPAQQPKYIYHHGHYHSAPAAPDNLWEQQSIPTDVEAEPDKTTWWSPTQQYSPPKIAYKPAHLDKTAYATCTFTADATFGDVDITIDLAQKDETAAMARVAIATNAANADKVVDLVINQYGVLTNDCADVGKEYNPLAELDSLGRVNQYQDPSRGTIPAVTLESDGSFTTAVSKDLMINLGGKTSVIGRSISAVVEGATVGCCIIGIDAPPPAPPAHTHEHTHAPAHYAYSNAVAPTYGSGGSMAHGHPHDLHNQHYHESYKPGLVNDVPAYHTGGFGIAN